MNLPRIDWSALVYLGGAFFYIWAGEELEDVWLPLARVAFWVIGGGFLMLWASWQTRLYHQKIIDGLEEDVVRLTIEREHVIDEYEAQVLDLQDQVRLARFPELEED